MRLVIVSLLVGLMALGTVGCLQADNSEHEVNPGDTPSGPGLFTGRRGAITIGGGGRTIRSR